MQRARWSADELAWLDANYAYGTIDDTVEAMRAEFGSSRPRSAVAVMASKRGLRKAPRATHVGERGRRASVKARWTDHPEWTEWMLEHDVEESVWPAIDGFEAEFGIRLTRGQVTNFRATHGTVKRSGRGGGRPRRPVGSKRCGKGGFTLVKVADEPSAPQSKDNWRFEHHVAYEEAHGPIPEGHNVMFADGDRTNLDPDNLVAMPRTVASIVASSEYHDRETLEAQIAIARLKVKVNDVERIAPRTCGVCGMEFVPGPEARQYARPVRTCRACLDAGLKSGSRGARLGEYAGKR